MILITGEGHRKELHKLYGNFQNTNTLFKVNYTTSKRQRHKFQTMKSIHYQGRRRKGGGERG
jgi:hypothetical protein